MTDIIELAFEAGAEFISTTKQDGFESPEYVETVWVFNQDELTKFAQLLSQQGEAVAYEVKDLSADDKKLYQQNAWDLYEGTATQPDTQQKLDKAREALRDAISMVGHPDNIAKLQQALKDTE